MTRTITSAYTDPLDAVWLQAAAAIGWTVVRDDAAYASFDGVATLTIATPSAFDPDDCLAQMIFHEMCHALVASPTAQGVADYGLENADDRDLLQEHATHRLQAHLAQRWGLREVFAVTTDWRPYWDALPKSTLAPGVDPAIALAREALTRAGQAPWEAAIRRAMAATRAIIATAAPFAPATSLLRRAEPPRAHLVAGSVGPDDQRCRNCAWFAPSRGPRDSDPDLAGGHCRMHQRGTRRPPATTAGTVACTQWEPQLDHSDCQRCGACCREAFGAVEVDAASRIARLRPEWIRNDIEGFGPYLPRPGGRCVALAGEGPPWLCSTYEDRPRSCRDFTVNSANCLEARRRVGLSERPF